MRKMVKINKNISIIGLGKISPYLCKSLISMDAYVTGVTSNKSRVELLSKLGVKVFNSTSRHVTHLFGSTGVN